MQALRRYSDYYATLHDETEAVGSLGAAPGRFGVAVHYSVLRGTAWYDAEGARLDAPLTHDIAVIWDEDHDVRVIDMVERLLAAGLLFPVLFIGERKGHLSLVLTSDFRLARGLEAFQDYIRQVEGVVKELPSDSWSVEVDDFSRDPTVGMEMLMIPCGPREHDIYLRNIDNLWQLGTKLFVRSAPTR